LAETYEPEARNLQNRLNDLLGKRSVQVDTQYHMRPGDRFFFHLQRGVPIRIELGQKELENRSIRLVRRDTGEKADVSWEKAPEVVQKTLDSIQDNLYVRALEFRKSNTFHVDSYEEFKKVLENRGGFITAYFGGTREDERDIKSETTATIRCFPLEGQAKGTCFYTGKKDVPLAVFAKAY
jgi:prolyl-tRNA synthetase